MAKISLKHLILVAFFLCFICGNATARTLKEVSNREVDRDDQNDLFTSKEKTARDADELVGMDYTPATKKPPIHN
uniref:Root meristem growth factor 9 n=1 Tax=Rhizophora mucronata TaxID=61149 RepID=A0A2P2JNX8_RHIMU